MKKNKSRILILMLMSVLVLIGLFGVKDTRVDSPAKADDISIVPKSKPTGNSVNLGFLTLISGYGLQPANQYTFKGQPVTLSVKIDLTPLDYIAILNYKRQWYETDNPTSSSNWTKVSGGTSNKLTVNPDKIGTVYYQDSYINSILGLPVKSFYSNVATVTTYPDPVDATSVAVSVDDDYLYNNQPDAVTTFAHATPDPYNSTAKLSWSVDNANLASIDSTTGELTANNSGRSGTVTVSATLVNSDGKPVVGSAKVKIGGGLDDQTVDEGKTATFKVQGNWDTINSITWHHVVDGKDSVVSGADQLSYTTPVTTYDNNNDQYYAVLKVPSKDNQGNDTVSTITTNKANLTVNPDLNPKVSANSTIYNNTYDDHNESNTVVNGVIGGDNLTVKGTFSDTNKNSIMKSGAVQVKLPDNIKSDPDNQTPDVTGVKVDGAETENYYIGPGPSGTEQYVYLFGIDFSSQKTHTYEFSFTVDGKSNEQFVTTPSLKGQDANEEDIDGTFVGNDLTINFSDDDLAGKANDIDYGVLKYSNIGKPVSGTIDGQSSADVLSVTDNRRTKNQAQIYLSQTNKFTATNGDILPSELRYYSEDGSYKALSPDEVLISDTPAGSAVSSIENNDSVGLKLYLFNTVMKNQQYSSTLNWTIQDAPK